MQSSNVNNDWQMSSIICKPRYRSEFWQLGEKYDNKGAHKGISLGKQDHRDQSNSNLNNIHKTL